MASSLAAMLAKFNSSQQKAANDNVEQQAKTQTKRPAARPPQTKPKPHAPAAAAPTPQPAPSAPKAKVNLKDQLKGTQNGFTPVVKTALSGKPAGGLPSSRVIGKRFKDVLDFLQTNMDSVHTPTQIAEQTGHDLRADAELRKRIESSERVRIDGAMGGYRYRPLHDIDDRTTLLNFIRDHPLGTYEEEVKDSYKGVVEDIQALQREKRIFVIHNPDVGQGQDALFPREMMDIALDEDVIAQFHAAVAPQDLIELQIQVERAGMVSALANQPLKRACFAVPKDKKKRPRQQRINIAKATNVHLPHLFTKAAPVNIDTA